MSEFLTAAEMDHLWRLLAIDGRLFGVNTGRIAATLREYAEVVEAVASMNPYDCACIFCGEQAGAPGFYYDDHADGCWYIRVRKLRGKEASE